MKPVLKDDIQQLETRYTHLFNDFEVMQEHVCDNCNNVNFRDHGLVISNTCYYVVTIFCSNM